MSEVFRHGARYPTNDFYDGKQTQEFHGQLTSIGKRQQYLIGNYLQSDYAKPGTNSKLFNFTLKPK